MPEYKYSARDINGRPRKGRAAAADPNGLLAELRGRGLFLLSYEETQSAKHSWRFSASELSVFCRELGAMLHSGVTMLRAFEIMLRRDIPKKQRAALESIYVSLLTGVALSGAMESQGRVFPPLLVSMVRAGEANGTLGQTALRMAEHYEKEHRLQVKIKSATTYPIILLVLTAIITTIVFTFVLPQFMGLYRDAPLPVATRVVVAISRAFTHYPLALLAGAVAVFLCAAAALRMRGVRLALDRFKLRAPVIGKLQKIIATARFSRTLSSLYASGLPIMTALEVSRGTIENAYIASQFDSFLYDVQNGVSLSESLDKIDGFDKKLCASVAVGEESGRLEAMLLAVADSFDHDSAEAATRMISVLEPVLICLMALIVGFIMIAVLLPIYNMYGEIDSGYAMADASRIFGLRG